MNITMDNRPCVLPEAPQPLTVSPTEIPSGEVIPLMGSYVVNPETFRLVKVGNHTWRELVRKGVLSGKYEDERQLCILDAGTPQKDIDAKIKELNKSLPTDQQAVRGRGRYGNSLIKKQRPPSRVTVYKRPKKGCKFEIATTEPDDTLEDFISNALNNEDPDSSDDSE